MTHWMVDNEHSMENAIAYTTHLAGTKGPGKVVNVMFHNEFMMELFLKNLVVSFSEAAIPIDRTSEMDINCIVPGDDEEEEGDEYDV